MKNKKMNEIEFLMKVLNCTEDEAHFYLEELCMMGAEDFGELYDVEDEMMAWVKSFDEEEELLDGDKHFIEQELFGMIDDIRSDFYAVGDDF